MAVLPQIETVVYLMLENRSLDNVLGWLHEEGVPNLVPHDSLPQHFDGIPVGAYNADGLVRFSPNKSDDRDGATQFLRWPRWDPYEGMANVQYQMYADGYGRMVDTTWGEGAPMMGFAYDFQDEAERGLGFPYGPTSRLTEVMGAYTRHQLPVLYGLAESFAVSDRWFCSVPTETDPNRAFAISGTSEGITGDIHLHRYEAPTFFEGLTAVGKSWKIYWRYTGALDLDLRPDERVCYTVDKNNRLHDFVWSNPEHAGPYSDFLAALWANEEIPSLCYLEPYWGWGIGDPNGRDYVGLQGTDYHPPAWVGPGEAALAELYAALRQSKQWENMLLVITFDEHGGTWDHVSPPTAPNPGDPKSRASSFGFTRLGPRVPTILVSPFIKPGTVFRAPEGCQAFDHCSTIRTILEWAGAGSFASSMGERVATATLFDQVLGEVRYDHPEAFDVPEGYAEQGGGLGKHNLRWLPEFTIEALRELAKNAASVEGLERLLAEMRVRLRNVDATLRSRPPAEETEP